jgi:protein-tyrosine phosphatase
VKPPHNLQAVFFNFARNKTSMNILMVCLGNICRSPLAEGILQHKITRYGLDASVESAGFEPFHSGDTADERAIEVAAKHGLDISGHRARLFHVNDFDHFDQIFVMDQNNYRDVMGRARNDSDKRKVDYILNELRPEANVPVPDPYYGRINDFEKVYEMLDQAIEKLVLKIRKES